MDLITTYFPTVAELTETDLSKMRTRLVDWFNTTTNDIDTRPGSPFNDTVIQPFSKLLLASEISLKRVLSDFALENVAAGTYYNCEFLSQYLKNFVPSNQEGYPSSGLVRLIFSEDAELELDKGTTFTIGSSSEYLIRTYNDGVIKILPVGSEYVPYENSFVLTQTSNSRYFVDLPLVGSTTSSILAGSGFSISEPIDNLTSAVALADFYIPETNVGIMENAKRAVSKFQAVSMNTREGMVLAVNEEFPDLVEISPVLIGDLELTRGQQNVFGTQPTLDLYVRSSLYGSSFKEVLRLDYDSSNDKFFGKFIPAHIPLTFDKVEYTGDSEIELVLTSYVRTKDPTDLPKLTAAYSRHNDYWVSFPMPRDTITNNNLIEVAVDSDGISYQYFEITYKADPIVEVVSRFMEDPSVTPMGVSLVVKSPVPLIFDELNISYRRKKGTLFEKDQAVSDVITALQEFTHEQPYSDSNIIDAMFYAGATNVLTINSDAIVGLSPADYYVNTLTTIVSFNDINASKQLIDKPAIGFSGQFIEPIVDTDTNPSTALQFAYGPRNMAFLISESNVKFTEK